MSITLPRPDTTETRVSQILIDAGNSPSQVTKTFFHAVIEKDEEGRYVARCTDLQGVVTDGTTEEEAIENLFEAVKAMLAAESQDKEFSLVIDSTE